MELPDLGKHCAKSDCNKLDFLPIRCDACNQTFCNEHYNYINHNCKNAYRKNNQVPICPLCNNPVPVGYGQQPDFVVGNHIDNDCQADPAKNRRKVFTNKCSVKRCKTKEIIPVVCTECSLNFCLKHRHPADHNCEGKEATRRHWVMKATVKQQQMHGNMSEDEALARAISLSMQENSKLKQEELDLALAKQLQAAETTQRQQSGRGTRTQQASGNRDRCNIS